MAGIRRCMKILANELLGIELHVIDHWRQWTNKSFFCCLARQAEKVAKSNHQEILGVYFADSDESNRLSSTQQSICVKIASQTKRPCAILLVRWRPRGYSLKKWVHNKTWLWHWVVWMVVQFLSLLSTHRRRAIVFRNQVDSSGLESASNCLSVGVDVKYIRVLLFNF